jgi:Uma2 family endonuclease
MPAVTAIPEKRYTVQEYLALEEAATQKHEYDNGEILAMSGGSYQHSQITTNLIGELRSRLRGKPCQQLESNMRVRARERGKYVYPDVSVVCGPPQFDADDPKRMTIVNPTVVVEVLSASSEPYDRAGKFDAYRTLASLRDYVLVSQWDAFVEAYHRHDDGRWSINSYAGLNASLPLPGIGIDIPLAEIYLDVKFEPRTSL